MAKMNRTKKENQAPERMQHSYSVRRAKEFKDGGIVFDLNVDDITIYGCRIILGKKGDFVAFPQRKGKDGNYYSHVYLALTEEETEEILEKVGKVLADD